jgi:outer membrane immunogenic protein
MRLMTLAVVPMAIFGTPALAADMAVKAPVRPAPAAVYSWTGFYIGANAGGVWGKSDFDNVIFNDGPPPAHAPALLDDVNAVARSSHHPTSAIFGVQAGYDLQVNQFVIGAVADINSMRLRASRDVSVIGPNTGIAITIHDDLATDWLATIRGRLGVAVGQALFYGTAGAAVTRASYHQNYFLAPGVRNSGSLANDAVSDTRWGWTAGAGIDYALTPQWSVRGEYLHVDFGSVLNDGVRVIITPPASVRLNTVFNHNVTLSADLVRVGLNYRFGGPVVATY